MNRNDRNEHFQNVSSVYMIIEKEIQSLKCFTIDETDQSHVYKIYCCLEDFSQIVP